MQEESGEKCAFTLDFFPFLRTSANYKRKYCITYYRRLIPIAWLSAGGDEGFSSISRVSSHKTADLVPAVVGGQFQHSESLSDFYFKAIRFFFNLRAQNLQINFSDHCLKYVTYFCWRPSWNGTNNFISSFTNKLSTCYSLVKM